MAKYVVTNKAVSDLNDIWEYTFSKWSENQADKYYKMLINLFQIIANNPELGKKYNEINPELFGLKANRHIIFYKKVNPGLIKIIRVLHERMDIKTRMSE